MSAYTESTTLIVPTTPRVGSTMLCEALAALTGKTVQVTGLVRVDAQPVSEEELAPLLNGQIQMTHSFFPPELLKCNGDFHVFYLYRGWVDTICSRLLYEKNVAFPQGLSSAEAITNVLEIYPDLPDATFLDLFIESNTAWLLTESARWRRSCIAIIDRRFTRLNYDKLYRHTEQFVAQLSKVVKPTVAQVEAAKAAIEFSSMQARYPEGFLRSGGSESYASLLSSQSLATLNKILTLANSNTVL